MKLATRILNFFTRLRAYFDDGCIGFMADISTGRLTIVNDHWEGYQPCMRPGCGHFRCEHSFGGVWAAEYIDPKLNEPGIKDAISWPIGCMNAGCKCEGFWTVEDLVAFVNKLNYARIWGSWELGQVPGVIHVESGVSTTIWIDTYTESSDEAARDAIYEVEKAVHDKHPGVLFDFNTRWSKPPQN